jgi:AraC family transcriptional activator FtrA
VQSGNIVTAAGSAAGLDMMLHLVRQDHGAQIAALVAQRLVVPLHREGGQAQFIGRPVLTQEKNRLSAVLDWVRFNLHKPLTVEQIAAKSAMSARTLQRYFLDTTGMSPLAWLTQERVVHAKILLETTAYDLEKVASQSGFSSLALFRYHFKRSVGITAAHHRRQFPASK